MGRTQAGRDAKAREIARGAEAIRALLGVVDRIPCDAIPDPAHAGRLGAVEEAARLVAEAALAAPGSLRAEPLGAFAGLVMRLAVEAADPAGARGILAGNADLAALEAGHGTLSAALMGVSVALRSIGSALGGDAAARAAPSYEGVVRVRLRDSRLWVRDAVLAVSRLERDVLRRPCDPALRRDAWGLACLVSIAIAHVSDHACVDARIALDRVAEAGLALTRAVALRASQCAGGAGSDDAATESCLALVAVVEQGVGLIRSALARRGADADVMAWRLVARGRTGLAPEAIARLAVGAATPGGRSRGGTALVRGGARYEAEWAA